MSVVIKYDLQKSFQRPDAYVKELGLKLIQWSYSPFDECYFMEVENYVPDPKNVFVLLDVNPEDFKWQKYWHSDAWRGTLLDD